MRGAIRDSLDVHWFARIISLVLPYELNLLSETVPRINVFLDPSFSRLYFQWWCCCTVCNDDFFSIVHCFASAFLRLFPNSRKRIMDRISRFLRFLFVVRWLPRFAFTGSKIYFPAMFLLFTHRWHKSAAKLLSWREIKYSYWNYRILCPLSAYLGKFISRLTRTVVISSVNWHFWSEQSN